MGGGGEGVPAANKSSRPHGRVINNVHNTNRKGLVFSGLAVNALAFSGLNFIGFALRGLCLLVYSCYWIGS